MTVHTSCTRVNTSQHADPRCSINNCRHVCALQGISCRSDVHCAASCLQSDRRLQLSCELVRETEKEREQGEVWCLCGLKPADSESLWFMEEREFCGRSAGSFVIHTALVNPTHSLS